MQSYLEIGKVSWDESDLKKNLESFIQLYQNRPIKNNQGGMLIGNMFYCWFLTKKLNPKYIIESGVHQGASTWLFEQAAPKAKIFSIDPNDAKILYRSERVKYYTGENFLDFAEIDWSKIDKSNTLCFFDDHYGLDRIKQSNNLNFKWILCDDNYYNFGGNESHPSGNAFSPKAAFRYHTQDAEFLKSILSIYYEFPPVAKNTLSHPRNQWSEIKEYTKPSLFDEDEIEKNDWLKIYQNEAFNYTWMCFIMLK